MQLGEINILTVLRFSSPGAYLGDYLGNEVLLPGKYIPENCEVSDKLEVFIYKDSEDRLVATTETPLVMHGFAYLTVKAVNLYGAFLDWGLEKDLMVPFREQNQRMEEDKTYLVTLQLDQATDRLFASMKVNRYLESCTDLGMTHKEVEILICEKTNLGVKVIVDNLFQGIIYRNDINRPLKRGERTRGFVLKVREDGKLDVRLENIGVQRFDEAEILLLELLKKKGYIELSDRSDPDEIRETIGMSKKLFKQTIGKLYKAQLIRLENSRIELTDKP